MRPRLLTVTQMMFIAGTRAAFAAGVALLASQRMTQREKRGAGLVLGLIGAASTFPEARLLFKKPSLRQRLTFATG